MKYKIRKVINLPKPETNREKLYDEAMANYIREVAINLEALRKGQSCLVEVRTADPTSPVTGQIWLIDP